MILLFFHYAEMQYSISTEKQDNRNHNLTDIIHKNNTESI